MSMSLYACRCSNMVLVHDLNETRCASMPCRLNASSIPNRKPSFSVLPFFRMNRDLGTAWSTLHHSLITSSLSLWVLAKEPNVTRWSDIDRQGGGLTLIMVVNCTV